MYDLQKHLAKLKKLPKYAYWGKVGSQAIQDITQRIDKAYKLFFGNLKRKVRTSPPSFKKVKRYTSFTLKQAGWKLLDGNKIYIRRVFAVQQSRKSTTRMLGQSTIKRDTLGNLYLYFVVQEATGALWAQNHQPMSGNSAGFDFGLKTFLVPSIGEDIESPLYFLQALAELKYPTESCP